MTNEEKKAYLSRYGAGKRQEALILEEIEALRTRPMSAGFFLNGMPKSNQYQDLSAYAAKLDELLRKLEAKRQGQVLAYKEIHQSIDRMCRTTEKEILVRRYILEQDWDKIAEEMNYSYRHIIRLHKEALQNFEV